MVAVELGGQEVMMAMATSVMAMVVLSVMGMV